MVSANKQRSTFFHIVVGSLTATRLRPPAQRCRFGYVREDEKYLDQPQRGCAVECCKKAAATALRLGIDVLWSQGSRKRQPWADRRNRVAVEDLIASPHYSPGLLFSSHTCRTTPSTVPADL